MEFKYKKASSYLLKEFGATGSSIGRFGSISLNTSLQLKRKLKEEHPDLIELSTIKGAISAEAEGVKLINIFLAIITLVISLISTPTTLYLSMATKPVDWMHEAQMYMYKEVLPSVGEATEQAQYLSDAISDDIAEYISSVRSIQSSQSLFIVVISVSILVGFFVFFLHYKWIMSLKECVDNAYTEQEKLLVEKKEEDIRAAALIKEKKEKDIRNAALIMEIRNSRLMKKR